MKQTILSGFLAKTLNYALSFGMKTPAFLSLLNNKNLLIEAKPLTALQICIQKDKLNFTAETNLVPDLVLKGPIGAFLYLILTHNHAAALKKGLQIEGDTLLAAAFQGLFLNNHFDWEEMLAQHTGDIFAHACAVKIRGLLNWQKNLFKSFLSQSVEYLQEEIDMLPQKAEVEEFLSSVDSLRAKTDRFKARLKNLQHKSLNQKTHGI